MAGSEHFPAKASGRKQWNSLDGMTVINKCDTFS